MNCKTFLLIGLGCAATLFVRGQSADAQSVPVYLAAKGMNSGVGGASWFDLTTDVEKPDGTFSAINIHANITTGNINNYTSTPNPQTVSLAVGRVYWMYGGTSRTSS